jgi:hypothetical protein
MENDDRELEKYLNDFQPRAVQPLPQRVVHPRLVRLPAAAALLVMIGGGFWYAERDRHSPSSRPQVQAIQIEFHLGDRTMNTIDLTKLALEDKKQFEIQLEAQSRQILPDFRAQQSTLQSLAKE